MVAIQVGLGTITTHPIRAHGFYSVKDPGGGGRPFSQREQLRISPRHFDHPNPSMTSRRYRTFYGCVPELLSTPVALHGARNPIEIVHP